MSDPVPSQVNYVFNQFEQFRELIKTYCGALPRCPVSLAGKLSLRSPTDLRATSLQGPIVQHILMLPCTDRLQPSMESQSLVQQHHSLRTQHRIYCTCSKTTQVLGQRLLAHNFKDVPKHLCVWRQKIRLIT
jgi:hypothetical protein